MRVNKINKCKAQLETKASSRAGQCIPAGCRVTLPRTVLTTKSVITMRIIFFANSASDCLRFAKSPPRFSNLVAPSTDGSAKCLVRYKERGSSNKQRKQRPNRCIIGDAILPETGKKLIKNVVRNLAVSWRHLTQRKTAI